MSFVGNANPYIQHWRVLTRYTNNKACFSPTRFYYFTVELPCSGKFVNRAYNAAYSFEST